MLIQPKCKISYAHVYVVSVQEVAQQLSNMFQNLNMSISNRNYRATHSFHLQAV